MLYKFTFLSCLIVTPSCMLLEDSLLSYLIVTKITTIYNSFMNRFQMLLKVDFPNCLIVTMLTTIYNSFMHIFLMFLGCFYELPYSHIAHNYILLPCAQISHVVEGFLSDLPYSRIAHNYILLHHVQISHVVEVYSS